MRATLETKQNFYKKVFPNSLLEPNPEDFEKIKRWINDDEFFNSMEREQASREKNQMDPSNFHKICDKKGKTLIIMHSEDECVFGGYSSIGWESSNRYINDPQAFIFTLRNPRGDPPQKFKVQNKQTKLAIADFKGWGPVFGELDTYNGESDLSVNNVFEPKSRLGNTFISPIGQKDKDQETFLFSKNTKIDKIEYYFVPTKN
ncbi:hypothetical protein M0811_01080 [Anaeramoeba ignava]|uniref:TLDc domain-containing protein n=1 Tax=Anaeramoeba ignava TaxID=1746090 RepID=A0A9Q0LL83_ANAIG|nr:hypothetical protein M0811_01080 [Anaeramoeba ignava]|eukprot:Anaeramoba_ignava/a95373_1105.p1 GENE.a95373_1105~~a95373_1105.p1  ORF type:complete len:203 (-),score=49.89 a95373_1105:171-779(-)